MFNKEKIERLESRILEVENKYEELIRRLENRRILKRRMNSPVDITYKAISLEDLETTQTRILDYLKVRLETTPSKTKLVEKSK